MNIEPFFFVKFGDDLTLLYPFLNQTIWAF